MKAAQINSYGDPSVIHINEIDKPQAGTGQVLVEVHASSLNPFDSALRNGYMKEMIPLQFPVTLGGDIAGVVTEVGEDVTDFAIGDKVYGQAGAVAGSSGALAEFAAAMAAQIAKSPKDLDFQHAASLPLVGVSALQALTEHLDIQADQKIFIHGGAGGIGMVAIPLAKHLGAYVATTATGDGIEAVKQLGADKIIDYKSQDFSTELKDYDAVFDTVGGDDFNKALHILRSGGIAVSMIAQADQNTAGELGVTAMTQGTKVTTESLNELSKLVGDGIVQPNIGQVFSLSEIQEAFTAREAGGTLGKIIIDIQ